MRALKTILIIIGVLFGVWLLASLFGPKTTHVERSTTINATPETVYTYAKYLRNMYEWGVWRRMDKDAKYDLLGEDGTVGAKQTWDGDTVMQGSMTITALEPNKSIKSDLAFADFMVSQVSLDMAPTAAGTEVTWSLHGDIPFKLRAMMLFMGMGSQVGKDFEMGLADLKRICEEKQAAANKQAPAGSYQITVVDRPAMLYVGKRQVVKWAEMQEFFGKNFGTGFAAIGKAGVPPAGAPSGVYFEWNEKDRTADLIAAVPVAVDAKAKLKSLDFYEAPASKAYVIDYTGGYHGIGKAHEAMDSRMKADSVEYNEVVIEEYITDPGQEPDSTKWHTNVVYLVK